MDDFQEDGSPVAGQKFKNDTAASAFKPKVALIDNDELYRSAISQRLREEGFQIVEFDLEDDGRLYTDIMQSQVHAILLCFNDAIEDGTAFIERCRQRGIQCPVALLSDALDDSLEEIALKNGAADFLCKSRSSTIISERTRLLINGARNAGGPSTANGRNISLGYLALNLDSHRASWRQKTVPLTLTEFKILRLLVSAGGMSLSYRQIYDVVHGPGFVAGDGPDGCRVNVRTLVKKIRKHFRKIDEQFDLIESVPGHGYRWRISKPDPILNSAEGKIAQPSEPNIVA